MKIPMESEMMAVLSLSTGSMFPLFDENTTLALIKK
jgi:hypothetical protein